MGSSQTGAFMSLNLIDARPSTTLRLVMIEFSNRGLDIEICIDILKKCVDANFKLENKQLEVLKMFNGTSRSAIKRRAKSMGRCFKCGKMEHEGQCKENTTRSNSECLELIRFGTIRSLAENPRYLRKNSYAREKFKFLISKAEWAYDKIKPEDKALCHGLVEQAKQRL